jgi:hypothetical protein
MKPFLLLLLKLKACIFDKFFALKEVVLGCGRACLFLLPKVPVGYVVNQL